MKTGDGYVSLNVYHDASGNSPIIASSSSEHDFDVGMPVGYHNITVAFEDIALVQVVAGASDDTIVH